MIEETFFRVIDMNLNLSYRRQTLENSLAH